MSEGVREIIEIGTLAVSAATCFITHCMLKTTRKQFAEDNRLKVRPYLVADIALTGNDDNGNLPTAQLEVTDSESPDSIRSRYLITLKNVGSGALHSAEIEWHSSYTKKKLFKNAIAIPKDSSWSFAADLAANKEYSNCVDTDCWLRIKYKDMLDNTYCQDIVFKIIISATTIQILRHYSNPQVMIANNKKPRSKVMNKEPSDPRYMPEGYEDWSV